MVALSPNFKELETIPSEFIEHAVLFCGRYVHVQVDFLLLIRDKLFLVMADPESFPLLSRPPVLEFLQSEVMALGEEVARNQRKYGELLGQTLECFKRHLK